MKCDSCKNNFPSELLHTLFGSHSTFTGRVCGICALKIMNEVHETKRRKFQGEEAERFRLLAVAHLKKQRRQKS